MSLIEKRNNNNNKESKLLSDSNSSLSNSSLSISLENNNSYASNSKYNLYKFEKAVVHLNYKNKSVSDQYDYDQGENEDYYYYEDDNKINKKSKLNIGYFHLFKYCIIKLRRKYGLPLTLCLLIISATILLNMIYVVESVMFMFFFSLFDLYKDKSDEMCNGNWHQINTCSLMDQNQLVGTLCMDLCISKSLSLPKCVTTDLEINDRKSTYKFYLIKEIDSSFMTPIKDIAFKSNHAFLDDVLSSEDFRNKIIEFIKIKLNETGLVEKIVDRLIYFIDVNKDEKINYAEASTLWSLLNMKHSFYILLLSNKAYIPSINNFCGNIFELEQIRNQVRLANPTGFFNSMFGGRDYRIGMPPLTPDYKVKISLGILEFFLDITSFNPNDDFGPSSLYLCSSIDSSFGYNFYNEAKLLNFDSLYSGKELEEKLSDRYCKSDLDCVFTEQCSMKCDLNLNKCSYQIVRPQILDYCLFLKDYLSDHPNVTNLLNPLVDKCLKLKNLYINDENSLFDKNEMPLNFNRHKSYIEASNYWKNSLEYTTITNELSSVLWNLVKFLKDPVKKKNNKKKAD